MNLMNLAKENGCIIYLQLLKSRNMQNILLLEW